MSKHRKHLDVNAEEVPTGYEFDAQGQLVEVPEFSHDYSGNKPHVELSSETWLWPVFFATYAQTGRIGAACMAVGGCAYLTVRRLLASSADFRNGLNEAREAYVGALHAELQRRAIHGTTKPVFYKGELVATYQEKDTRALELLLKHASAEWRLLIDGPRSSGSNTTVTVNSNSVTNILATSQDALEATTTALDPRTMSQAERDAMRALLTARRAREQATALPAASMPASAGSGLPGPATKMLDVIADERGHAATRATGVAPVASTPAQDGSDE